MRLQDEARAAQLLQACACSMGHGSSGGCKLGSIITPGDLSCHLPTVSGPFSRERASLHGLPQPQLGFGFSLALYSPPGYVCISSSPQPTSSAPQISMIPLSSAIMPSHVQGKKSLVARAAQHQAQQKAQVMTPALSRAQDYAHTLLSLVISACFP